MPAKKNKQPRQKFSAREAYLLLRKEQERNRKNKTADEKIYKEFDQSQPPQLEYKGKTISHNFDDLIRNIAKASNKEPEEILTNKKYEKVIDDLINEYHSFLYKTPKALIKYLKKNEGTLKPIKVRGGKKREVKLTTILRSLAELEREGKKIDVVYLGTSVRENLDGTIEISFPESYEFEEFMEFLDNETEYVIYPSDK